jgi:hypothetical protein
MLGAEAVLPLILRGGPMADDASNEECLRLLKAFATITDVQTRTVILALVDAAARGVPVEGNSLAALARPENVTLN